jgi:hypothetical protein
MTAARGIVHAECREHEFARRGGTLHGVQLWVNLRARDKTNPPGYQDLSAARIPVVTLGGSAVRVVAGRFAGAAGPARTHSPMRVLHLRLSEGERVEGPVPKEWNVLV